MKSTNILFKPNIRYCIYIMMGITLHSPFMFYQNNFNLGGGNPDEPDISALKTELFFHISAPTVQ